MRRWLACAAAAIAACGSPKTQSFTPPSSVDALDAGSGFAGELTTDAAASTNRDAGCPESAKRIYVTGFGRELWTFDPPTRKFTEVGPLTCLPVDPDHMTIDRQGLAWIVADGLLYNASTTDASCSAVSTWTANPDFTSFALSFVGTSSAFDDVLYLMAPDKLARFHIKAGTLEVVANAPAGPASGDMTSGGDGILYYLGGWQSPHPFFEISPTDGSILGEAPIAINEKGNQGLAFWGGSFYVFEDQLAYQFEPKTRTVTWVANAPLPITGAGQSTCVPKAPPK